MSDEYYCRRGNWPIPRKLDSKSAFVVPLSSMQRKKLTHLLGEGAKVLSAKLLIKTKIGICTIDDFGKVEWL